MTLIAQTPMSHRDDDHAEPVEARSRDSQQRPASTDQLTEKALDIDWDPSRKYNYWLHTAEHTRNQARTSFKQGDLETAFIFFTRAAHFYLEKIPTHPTYITASTEVQRMNLRLVSIVCGPVVDYFVVTFF